MPADSGPSRRAVLRGLGLLLPAGVLLGCTGDDPSRPAPRPSPTPDMDAPVRARVAQAERALIEQYDVALAAFPELADRLQALADEHRAHLEAVAPADPAPTGTATPTPTHPPAPPVDAASAVTAIAAAERDAAAARVEDALDASPELARLLAGIGGSEAVHAALLAAS
jgi:hypothetical protein